MDLDKEKKEDLGPYSKQISSILQTNKSQKEITKLYLLCSKLLLT